jgi:hypothetical protein
MKTRFIPTLALAGMLALAPGAAAGLTAQAAAAPAGSIVGFSSIPWGSSEAAIVARAGRPAQVTPMRGDIKVLAYTEQLLGEDVTTLYYLHAQHGLIAGGYFVPYTYGNSCWEIYGKFKSAIAERYSDLRPEVLENNQSQSLDMCAAIGIHRADAATTWNDPANGARTYVQIKDDPREVQTMYFSAQGLQDIDAMNAGERRDRF